MIPNAGEVNATRPQSISVMPRQVFRSGRRQALMNRMSPPTIIPAEMISRNQVPTSQPKWDLSSMVRARTTSVRTAMATPIVAAISQPRRAGTATEGIIDSDMRAPFDTNCQELDRRTLAASECGALAILRYDDAIASFAQQRIRLVQMDEAHLRQHRRCRQS